MGSTPKKQDQSGNNAVSADEGTKGTAVEPQAPAEAAKGTERPPARQGQRAFEEGNESDSRSIESVEPGSGGGRESQGGNSERSKQKE